MNNKDFFLFSYYDIKAKLVADQHQTLLVVNAPFRGLGVKRSTI